MSTIFRNLMEHQILEQLWTRALYPEKANPESWNQELETLYRYGVGIEEVMRYLYFEKPELHQFYDWIANRHTDTMSQSETITTAVLSEADLQFWQENGYLVLQNAISDEDCKATVEAIWDFLALQPDDRDGWYRQHEEQRGLMLTFSDHPALNKNRSSARIRKAYEQLYGTDKIYKTIDKVSFNPPETDSYHFLGSPLHWDVSLKQPIPFGLQGLLYLTDCGPEDGAFHCVPGFHNEIGKWMSGLKEEENPREVALQTLKAIPITGKAGDFVIWHQALPHCASANHGTNPRMVQYLTYFPEQYETASEWL
ncbi:phytanoyl-CoA dioxygenase family protein [Flavobacterium sp.]|uniref:phytanoyl-CoA dioxygenase family protein n=1 Tax=Flavobacterium sp. TaxID=239 RepID=UPI0026175995|nr:phytanoyl-CoA dioxygenase family protein [Flavobacterium sp.]